MPICHICGKRLTNILGKRVEGVPILVDGVELRAHIVCAESEGYRVHDARNGRVPSRDRSKGAK